MKKLAIIITHPIQYYVPLFQLLAHGCTLKVFYTWGEKGTGAKYDPDFKQVVNWDVPLLSGYDYEFLENTAKQPGSHHFQGINNPDLKAKVKDFKPDALLVYGWAYRSHLACLRHFKGKIPIWFRGDSTLLDQAQNFKALLRSIALSWVYKHVDRAFYVGTANKAYFEKFGLNANQLIFAPHAIDNQSFAADRSTEVLALRKKLNIMPHERMLLFAGKFDTKKNPHLLLQAFMALNLPNVHLVMVGNGTLEESLKLKVEGLKLQVESSKFKVESTKFKSKSTKLKVEDNTERIHFLDFQNQSQMPVVYQACDVFCLPSQGPGETWGLAVNEAMACGKAILVSNKVGCAVDLIENGKNGYIFASGNLADLKDKLAMLLNDQTDLGKMGQAAKDIIQHWSINVQAETLLKILYA